MIKGAGGKIAGVLVTVLLALMTLTACFGTNTVIKFETNGGSPCDSVTVEDGVDSIELPVTVRDGYDFDGWYSNRALTNYVPNILTGSAIPTASVTFYAKWKLKTIVITFVVEGVTIGSRSVDYNSTVKKEDFPSLDAHPDYEWEEGDFVATYDRTVTAIRTNTEEPDYTITYKIPQTKIGANGEVERYFADYAKRVGKEGAAVSAPLKPGTVTLLDFETKIGYQAFFDGWYYDEACVEPCAFAPTAIAGEDLILYAKYDVVGDDSKFLFYEEVDGGLTVTGLTVVGAYQSSISVPATIKGKPVVAIGKELTSYSSTDAEKACKLGSTFLERVIIPETVKVIGDFAFYGCTALREVVFVGDAVTKIGYGAFVNCFSLETFNLPDNVTGIGAYAFARGLFETGRDKDSLPYMSLNSFEIGPSSKLSTIGEGAFIGCTELKTITLSTVMRLFNPRSFSGSGIESVDFYTGGALKSENGAVYSRNGAVLYYYPLCGAEEYEMPVSVTEIADNAFEYNKAVKRIGMSPNLTSIGVRAFAGCENLLDADLSGTALKTIKSSAFEGCSAITVLSFPEQLTAIDACAFYECVSVSRVMFAGTRLGVIGNDAFYRCESLRSVLIPTDVASIGDRAFYGCKALTSLRFGTRSVLKSIGDYAFYDCTGIGTVLLPFGLERVGDYAFATEGNVKMALEFDPDTDLSNITYLGDYAFMNTGISSVTVSEKIATNEDFGRGVFYGCTSLKQAYFRPAGYTDVPKELFYGCTSLTRITFSNNIEHVGDYAFYNCSSIEYVAFGLGIRSIGASSFENCISLTNQGAERKILPTNLVSVGERAFYNCKSLTTVNIPAGMESIEKETFARCEALTDINYDEGGVLNTIGENAFAYCTSLVRAMLPVTLAERNAENTEGFVGNPFNGCSSLANFVFNGDTDGALFEEGGVIYRRLPNASGTGYAAERAIYAYPTSRSTAPFSVPPTVAVIDPYAFYGCIITGLSFGKNTVTGGVEPVTLVSIGEYAFAYTGVTSVNLSYRVYEVGDYAFYGSAMNSLTIDFEYICDGVSNGYAITNSDLSIENNLLTVGEYAFARVAISRIKVPERVKAIGAGAFAYDYSLSSVDFDSEYFYTPLTIGDRVFEKDNLIKTVTVPSRVTYIGAYAFTECGNLATVSFEETRTSLIIGDYAFSKVHYLYEINLPSGLESMGTGVFEGDTRLKYVNFPSESKAGALEIPDRAFESMPALNSITIPGYVTKIGDYAFINSSLKEITFSGTNSSPDLTIGKGAFLELKLKSVALPDNLTYIGEDAFRGSELESVLLNGGGKAMYIGNNAFRGTRLAEFDTLGRVSYVGEYAFADNVNLKRFNGSSLYEIQNGTFYGDVNLTELALNSDVEKIGEESFFMTGITELSVRSCRLVGTHAFYGSRLQTVSIVSSGWNLKIESEAFAGMTELESCVLSSGYAYGGTVTVDGGAFTSCTALTSLYIAGYNVELAEGFAAGATGLGYGFFLTEFSEEKNYSFIEEEHVLYSSDMKTFFYYPAGKDGSIFRVYEGVEKIADYAFYGNTGLTAVLVSGENVTKGARSFAENSEDLVIFVSYYLVDEYKNSWQIDNIAAKTDVADGFVLAKTGAGEYMITEYLGSRDVINVNSEIVDGEDTYRITAVGDNAFKNNTVIKELYIGSGVKTVSNHAFDGCVNLRYVYVGESVTSIKSYAFNNCPLLRAVDFNADSRLRTVGNYAFAGGVSLEEMTVPGGVESIGIYAFAGCVGLRSITVNEGVVDIGNNAFEGCELLYHIELPSTVTSLGSYVFSDCKNLVYVKINNEGVCAITEKTFSGTPEGLYFFVPTEAAVKGYKSDSVWRSYISKIVSSEGRISGHGYENYVLTRNDTGYTLTAYLGTEEDVVIESDLGDGIRVTAIGEYAIGKFARSVEIRDGVTEIGTRAFYYAVNMESITIPCGLVKIGNYAFAGLSKLQTVTVQDEEPEYVLVNLPEIGAITVHELEEKPSDSLVAESTDKKITQIYDADTNIKINTGNNSKLREIGNYAFYGCSGLTEFVIPESVCVVGDYAFCMCDGLESVTFKHGTDSSSGENVLRKQFYFEGSYYNDHTKENERYYYRYDYTETVNLSIGKAAFAGIPLLKSVTVNCRVTSMGEYAFSGCERLESLYLNYKPSIINDAAIPATTGNVFCGVSKKLILPSAEDREFLVGCDKLSLILPTSDINNRYKTVWTDDYDKHRLTVAEHTDDRGFVYAITSSSSTNRQVTVINYLGSDTEVTFPTEMQIGQSSYSVTRIGRESFGGNDDINGYVIGKDVTKVTVPQSVMYITQDAFRNSESLREVVFVSDKADDPIKLRTIEAYAFAGCKNLTKIVIPSTVEAIEPYAFYGCTSLSSGFRIVETADRMLTIGGYAFAGCTSFETFYVPAQVTAIGSAGSSTSVNNGHVFDGCTSLREITFSDDSKVVKIDGYTFAGTKLKEITLPASVETLADYTFADCRDLLRIYVERDITVQTSEITKPGNNMFAGIDNPHLKIYVPNTAAYDQYAARSGWAVKTVIRGSAENISADGQFAFETDGTGENMTVKLTDYRGTEENIFIPRTLNVLDRDCDITTIGSYFANKTVKKVTFDTLSQVGSVLPFAFAECTSLEEIKLPDRITVVVDGEEKVVANGVKTLGRYAFSGCTGLTDITLSSQINTLSEHTFVNCSALKEITLTRSIEKIESSAFSGCTSLARVTVEFGDNVNEGNIGMSIGNSVFEKAGTGAGGLVIIVPDDKAAIFRSGWNSVAGCIHSVSEVVGDYVVTLNDYGDALTVVQYLGEENVIDLTSLTLKGLKIEEIKENSVASTDTLFIVDGDIGVGDGIRVRSGDFVFCAYSNKQTVGGAESVVRELKLIEYLGSEARVDLTRFKFNGLEFKRIESTAASADTVFVVDEKTTWGYGVNTEIELSR